MEKSIMYHQIYPWLYIGSKDATKLKQITAIINLTDEKINPEHAEVFNHRLPDQELLDAEFGKTIKKLDDIAEDIDYLRPNNIILICCYDGKNKCVLAAGYYLIKNNINSYKINYNGLIQQLETAYFTPQQCIEDAEERQRIINEQNGAPMLTGDDLILKLELSKQRLHYRCLTNQSFNKILRLTAGAKK